tara:strand:- start:3791 stop:4609 length:819 start_codon:yes stop_codon:yes gene_type:complete
MLDEIAPSLQRVLLTYRGGIIAVSGGVDSMTLASFAQKLLGVGSISMVHAISPAVPKAATALVRRYSIRENWDLTEVDAGEFEDPAYKANPLNRCFYCKTNLYETLSKMSAGVVISGTNCDDLDDYRPGLIAAKNNQVRHPYVEASMKKDAVRELARKLQLDDLAELPASPCLSSRIETGIPVEEKLLVLIDNIETWLRRKIKPSTVRCRVRKEGLVIELDPITLAELTKHDKLQIIEAATSKLPVDSTMKVQISLYRQGSAFVPARLHPAA